MIGRVGIVNYDGKPLIAISNLPRWYDQATLLDIYAEKYGFERDKLTIVFRDSILYSEVMEGV
jgi:hypothetical protein